MSAVIKKFNPFEMPESDILQLATGREELLETLLSEMKNCLMPKGNQHYLLYGPRGCGKSFFARLLKIHHDRSAEFENSLFILLPEEQDNISYVADLLDFISVILEGKDYSEIKPRWHMDSLQWEASISRLNEALRRIKSERNIEHVFFTQENLQLFIPNFDKIESARMRSFLSDFDQVTLIGSSLRPDLDNDYNKRLFQVFKKFHLLPWKGDDFIKYYQKKAELSKHETGQLEAIKKSKHKIRAIAQFTGGSPRLALILSDLILGKNVLDTAQLLDCFVDELTPYYSDMTQNIPPKSRVLFDMLIRKGENITQSALAASFDPPLEQKTIARSFNWLLDNHYVVSSKLSKGNTKNYYVRDRMYVLYYQKRQVYADKPSTVIEIFVEFLTEFFSQNEQKSVFKNVKIRELFGDPSEKSYEPQTFDSENEQLMAVNEPIEFPYVNSNDEVSISQKLKAKQASQQDLIDAALFCFEKQSWSLIERFIDENKHRTALSRIIGLVIAEVIHKCETSDKLFFYNSMTDVIRNTEALDFVLMHTALFARLFKLGENSRIIASISEELKLRHNDSLVISLIVEANQYLINPKKEDISALHPDVRLIVLAVENQVLK